MQPKRCSMVLAAILATGSSLTQAAPSDPAMAVGSCVQTQIASIGTRLEDGVSHHPIAGSGSAVTFSNGLYQVSYETVRAIARAKPGDPVSICLVALPHDCPPDDNRGKLYRTTDLRTHERWTLPDAEHMCGGA